MNTARLSGTMSPSATVGTPRVLRRCLGVAIMLAGTTLGVHELTAAYASWNSAVREALIGGLLAAGATAAGTVPVALSRTVTPRWTSAMLGFGAGVMLAASMFSLILPALHQARQQGASVWTAGLLVGVGILLGASFLLLLGKAFSPSQERVPSDATLHSGCAHKRAWLFVAAITLHNVPEGVAIGVAFAGLDHAGAVGLAAGIGIQDIPEGLAVALALRSVGYGRRRAVSMGIGSGLVEPLFAACGAALVTSCAPLLPWGLAAAAGAMLFVLANDVIPETHRASHGIHASAALMLGFVVMMFLDTAWG
jgi:ZIP family zinc transporter